MVVQGVSAGTFSNTLFANSNLPTREYQALQIIGRYRLSDSLTLDGNYTHQFTNDGNFEGEGTNTPGTSSVIGDYPEIRSRFAHFPEGALNDFAEHKLRLWTTYNLNFNRAGNLSIGFLMNYDSGRTFTATDSIGITATQDAILASAGYIDAPSSQTIFFGERGNVEFDDALTFDLSLNYTFTLFSDLELWIKADIFNVFDDDTQIAGRSAVDANFDGPLDSLGIPTTFTLPSNFERARNNADFVNPQEYQFTVGFRF